MPFILVALNMHCCLAISAIKYNGTRMTLMVMINADKILFNHNHQRHPRSIF